MPEMPAQSTAGTTITATPVKTEDNLVKVVINETISPHAVAQSENFLPKAAFEQYQATANAVAQQMVANKWIHEGNPEKIGEQIKQGTLEALILREYPPEKIIQGTPGFDALVAAAVLNYPLPMDKIAEKMQEALELVNVIENIKTPPQFASVDSVELVGFAPANENAVQNSITPLAQQLILSIKQARQAIDNMTKTLPPGQTLWQNLPEPFKPLVQSVEEANNAIDNAITIAAGKVQAQPQPTKPAAMNTAMQLLNVPAPTLSKVSQVAPCGCDLQQTVM